MADLPRDTVSLVVVDDHPVFRLGMVALLGTIDGFTVVGQAASRTEALEVVDGGVNAVLMDPHLGDDSGGTLVRAVLPLPAPVDA